EMAPIANVVLGYYVFSLQQPGLSYTSLRSDIDEIATIEARQFAAREAGEGFDALPCLELEAGEVSYPGAVEASEVRAVAPDDTPQWGSQPPQLPGAAEDPLGFPV